MQLVSISLDVKECSHRNEQQLQYLTKMIYSQVHYTRQVTPWLYFKAQKKTLKQQCENMHQNVRQQKIKTIWRKWKRRQLVQIKIFTEIQDVHFKLSSLCLVDDQTEKVDETV